MGGVFGYYDGMWDWFVCILLVKYYDKIFSFIYLPEMRVDPGSGWCPDIYYLSVSCYSVLFSLFRAQRSIVHGTQSARGFVLSTYFPIVFRLCWMCWAFVSFLSMWEVMGVHGVRFYVSSGGRLGYHLLSDISKPNIETSHSWNYSILNLSFRVRNNWGMIPVLYKHYVYRMWMLNKYTMLVTEFIL